MCGIWGIVNKKPAHFDRKTFNILGYANDSRGGDSCGIFIDGKYEYGTGDKKYYQDFYEDSPLLKAAKVVSIALGHDRKASVGAINEATAQPIIIKENDKPVFVVLHNGTIKNYTDLAKKYIPNINIKGMTDSQVMANIFYNCGYDALAEYEGGSVFFIVDYRSKSPKVMFFKGASKKDANAKENTDERPFYFARTKNSFIFSSLDIPLDIMTPDCEVYTAVENTLIALVDNKLVLVGKYDRSDKCQTPTYSRSSYPSYYYGDYEYGNYYGYGYNYGYGTYGTPYRGDVNKVTPSEKKTGSFVVFDGLCMYNNNGAPCHGEYILDHLGIIRKTEIAGTAKFYFWYGIMLRNKECYDFLETYCTLFECIPKSDLILESPELLAYCSPYPIRSKEAFGDYKFYTSVDCSHIIPQEGMVKVLFGSFIWNYNDGNRCINPLNVDKKVTFEEYLQKGFAKVSLPNLDDLK